MTLADYGFAQWFWLLMTIAAIVWYCTVTVYVAVRGTLDIRSMFEDLAKDHEKSQR